MQEKSSTVSLIVFVKSVWTTSKGINEANSVLVKTDLAEELPDDVHEGGHASEAEAAQPQRDREDFLDTFPEGVKRRDSLNHQSQRP